MRHKKHLFDFDKSFSGSHRLVKNPMFSKIFIKHFKSAKSYQLDESNPIDISSAAPQATMVNTTKNPVTDIIANNPMRKVLTQTEYILFRYNNSNNINKVDVVIDASLGYNRTFYIVHLKQPEFSSYENQLNSM
ncbi:MAG: hypothetical protein OEY59_12470 [Deltaproteobacteria bacterium]|nr:hypothetical protein [Deltaproteobacteria bacterium]